MFWRKLLEINSVIQCCPEQEKNCTDKNTSTFFPVWHFVSCQKNVIYYTVIQHDLKLFVVYNYPRCNVFVNR